MPTRRRDGESLWGVRRAARAKDEPTTGDVDASPKAQHVLDLQRRAGNTAVAGAVAQRSLWGDAAEWFGGGGGGSPSALKAASGDEAGTLKGLPAADLDGGGIKDAGFKDGGFKDGGGFEDGGFKEGGFNGGGSKEDVGFKDGGFKDGGGFEDGGFKDGGGYDDVGGGAFEDGGFKDDAGGYDGGATTNEVSDEDAAAKGNMDFGSFPDTGKDTGGAEEQGWIN